jgi:MFS family permease
MYVICYVDRANLSFANLCMSADFGFSDRVYGLGSGIFFIGYILFEIPGAIIVERWSARKWMARIMLTGGVVTIVTAFIKTAHQFYAARFFLGAAEASFAPGIFVYLTHWFRASDGKAMATFYIAIPAASLAGSLVARWLLTVHWSAIAGWRWIFIVEGIPPITVLIVAAGWYAYYPPFWTMPMAFLSESAAAACFGLINSVAHEPCNTVGLHRLKLQQLPRLKVERLSDESQIPQANLNLARFHLSEIAASTANRLAYSRFVRHTSSP